MAQIKIASGMKGYNKTALTMTFVLTLMCLAGLQLLVGSRNAVSREGEGWQIGGHGKTKEVDNKSRKWIQTISWHPRLAVYHNFLSEEECDHIKKQAAPFMKRSMVRVDGVTNERTSYGTYLRRLQDDIIANVEERVANWTHLPAVHQEDMQVLRYEIGGKYSLHKDVRPDQDSLRMATVIMALSEYGDGGETAFLEGSEYSHPHHTAQEAVKNSPNKYCSGVKNVAMKLKKGDAIFFHSLTPSGEFDSNAFHTGCEVHSGVKWGATIWLHTDPFKPEEFHPASPEELHSDPGHCHDLHRECALWAESGQCEKDPVFMKGELDRVGPIGHCRESCGICTRCHAEDRDCFLRNRVASGYINIDISELTA